MPAPTHALIEYCENPPSYDVVGIKTHVQCAGEPKEGAAVDVKYGQISGKSQYSAAIVIKLGNHACMFIVIYV
jgi:hypothetical protein